MLRALMVSALLAAGCGAGVTDETAELTPDEVGKADALSLAGAFEIDASSLRADDLVYVRLLAPSIKPGVVSHPGWVWDRCYDTPCSQLIPQDGTYVLYKSGSTGKKYVKFYTTHVGATAAADDLVDVYQYTLRGKSLKLRKANTSRTFSLTAFSDKAACQESGGSVNTDGTCDCSALGTGAFGSAAYLEPGLGGCTLIPDSSEAMCDDTRGSYTDDDNNLVGSFCECGVGRYFADGAGCTNVPR